MNKKLIILTTLLATIFAASFMGGAPIVYAQEVDEDQVAAETMLSLLTDSEAEVTSLFETIIGDGGTVPEDATDALIDAQELHAEAQTLYELGDYEESIEKATEALNKYGEALTEATPEEPEILEVVETIEIIDLSAAIDLTKDRLEQLEEIARQLNK